MEIGSIVNSLIKRDKENAERKLAMEQEFERKQKVIVAFNKDILPNIFDADCNYRLLYQQNEDNSQSSVKIYREDKLLGEQSTNMDSVSAMLKDIMKLLQRTVF